LIYVNPRLRPDILWQRYSANYFLNEYLPQHGEYDEQVNYNVYAPYLRELSLYAPARGRLLDVGCAIGLFLAAARLDGWEVMGNELSSFAANYAHEQFGISVIAGSFETLNLPPGSFDAVTMWETIEHLLSPRTALHKAAELLKPGGVLALSTPNTAGLSFRFLRDRWWIIAPREHTFYFTPKTITRLLKQTGFEVKSLRTTGFDFRYFRNTLMGRTVMPWHIHVTELRAQATALDGDMATKSRAATAWSKLKPRVVDLIARIIFRMKWADTMYVYAVRRT
jgi:2-polyprenyl-3-methyl-5-hydroxy-6-metoxy-1,4-benzoquinol methylase